MKPILPESQIFNPCWHKHEQKQIKLSTRWGVCGPAWKVNTSTYQLPTELKGRWYKDVLKELRKWQSCQIRALRWGNQEWVLGVGEVSNLLSVAMVNVMPKSNSEGERVYFSLQVECHLTVVHHWGKPGWLLGDTKLGSRKYMEDCCSLTSSF